MSGKSKAKDPVLSIDAATPQKKDAEPATPRDVRPAAAPGSARKRPSDKAPATPAKKGKEDSPAPATPTKDDKVDCVTPAPAPVSPPKPATASPPAKAKDVPVEKPALAVPTCPEPPAFDQYPLPAEMLAVKDKREPKRQWPKNQLNFKMWPVWQENERDECVRDVLLDRGWRDCDAPCDPTDYGTLEETLACKGGLKKYWPPSRCLYVAGDDSEVRKMLKNLGNSTNYCITGFPGGEVACFKTYTCKALGEKPYVPKTFLVPQQKNELLKEAAAMPGSYWVGKPKNDYGGKKLCVTYGAEPLAGFGDGTGKQGVVQQYISNPLKVGPYKFHMRVYLLVTSLDGPRAYVHNDLTVMFATMPFSLDAKYLGPGAEFESRVHLSNYDINARTSNAELFFKDKEGVGEGCMWGAKRLEQWLEGTKRPELDPKRMWRQVHILCRDVAKAIAAHRSVKGFAHAEGVCHELFGLDVMMDDDGKVWLLECNNSPGLEYVGTHFTEGEYKGRQNPDAAENDAVTWRVIDDRMALLGFDYAKTGNEDNYVRVC